MNAIVAGIASAAACGALAVATATPAWAGNTPVPLPLVEGWTDVDRLDQTNGWIDVPGITGHRGNGLADEGTDPRTVVDGAPQPPQVSVDHEALPNGNVGGVFELELDDPLIAIRAHPSADAPHLHLRVDTTGAAYVRVTYDLVDLDGGGLGPVALQYRVGSQGPFLAVPGGYVDGVAEEAVVTTVDVVLPEAAADRARVDLRLLTTRQPGREDWIGIDDLAVTASAGPTGALTLAPPALAAGEVLRATVDVTPGVAPPSTGLEVGCNVSALGGPDRIVLFDDGAHGDGAAGDLRFSRAAATPGDLAAGTYTVPCRVRDAEGRIGDLEGTVTIVPVCGDARVEGDEACDDGDVEPGDGCATDCTAEDGWWCAGSPSACVDLDECDAATDDCDPNATCTNLPGSFACACDDGWTGDGRTCADVDECADGAAGCDPLATCTNTPGGATCACPDGYAGDGASCLDVDECAEMLATCSPHAVCTNTDGAYGCACADGYTGDGVTCEPVPEEPTPPPPPSSGGCTSGGGAAPWLVLLALAYLPSSRMRRAARRRSS